MAGEEADRSIIRRAGKTTAILQFFAIGLVVVLGFIYSDISSRYTAMESGIRENAMWSVYQLDREARNLEHELSLMIAEGDVGIAVQKKVSLRYDILYSRMDMLEQAKFQKNFTVDEEVARRLIAVRAGVFGNVAMFDAINSGKPASLKELMKARDSFAVVMQDTEELVTYTNTQLSVDRAETREQVVALEKRSLILIIFLSLIVVSLVFIFRRQLSSVRAAGLSFERMAASFASACRAAEAGNRARSQFMATMGHEIRTPLNAILGTVELMELAPHDEEAGRNLKTIRKSGEALLDIINEILDFSKIEHGKLELEYRTVDLQAMAESVVDMMRGRALDSGNRLALEIEPPLALPFIRTDATRLRQVILNLVSNAIKFTADGSVTLRLREEVGNGHCRLRIEVQDTGIGIDEAGRAKLFLPFSQVDASIARRYGGTGLGLTICKEIIERLGGSIGVDSKQGEGSTFWFEIPVEAAEKVPVSSTPAAKDERPLPRLKILVAEDNTVNLHVATKFLTHLGQDVHSAENGHVAVDKATNEHFDLILMDMQMPVMDGIEATQLIRRGGGLSAMAPIVAMTANASDDDREKCRQAGMTGFQSKPISIAQLRDVLSETAMKMKIENPMLGIDPTPGSTDVHTVTAEATSEVQPELTPPDPPPSSQIEPVQLAAYLERKKEMVEVLGEEDFRELLGACFADIDGMFPELEAALAQSDATRIDRLLHKLKGAAGNVGLSEVALLSQRLREQPLRKENIASLKRHVEEYRLLTAA